jgi:dTDP-4-dehydrorhamnose reductase
MLSRSDAYGLYHTTAEGSCSWYEFAQEIFLVTNTQTKLEVAASEEFLPRYLGHVTPC